MIPALLWVILWTNVVIKWRNKVCLDLKTTMMLWGGFLLNHEKVDFKLIMKQYWLLGVENDEAIVRNDYEEDLKIWKKQIFISSFSVFSWWASVNPNLLFIAKRWRMVDGYVRWEWWMRIFGDNGRWERYQTWMVGGRPVGTKRESQAEVMTHCNFKFKTHLWELICVFFFFFEREALMKSEG